MVDPFGALGLPADSDEEAVRTRYLELVRLHPPEQDPARFAEIRSAYEQLKDRDEQLLRQLSQPYRLDPLEGVVDSLRRSANRPRLGLADLQRLHRTAEGR